MLRGTSASKTKEEAGKLAKIVQYGASPFPQFTKYFSVTRSRRASFVGHVARVEKEGNAYIILVANRLRKRTLGRSRHRCENNCNMNVENRIG